MISVGDRFERLTAVAFVETRGKGRMAYWRFQCDCGTSKVIRASHVKYGRTASCGCLALLTRTKHGLSRTPEWYVWCAMIERCRNPNSTNAKNYGHRGITVCDEWNDFANFIRDMGYRPSGKHSLERIDNDGPYSPTNCRWATMKEQARNTRRNRYISYRGHKITFSEAARMAGVDPSTMWYRINTGWDHERAVETGPTTRR